MNGDMRRIMIEKSVQPRLKLGFARRAAGGNFKAAREHAPRPVADEMTDVFRAHRIKAGPGQRMIRRGRQIVRGVNQRAVEIE